MSVSRILIALAVSDTLLIVLLPFNKLFVRQLLGVDIRALSDTGCKMFFWAFRTAKMTSSWLVVLISIERFIATWFPFHAKGINTTRKAIMAILSVYIVIGVYNGVWCSITDRIIGGICLPNTRPPGLEHVTGAFLVTGLTIYCFVPAPILCILNTLIVIKIVKSLKRTQKMQKGAKKEIDKKPTVMLIGIAVAFVVLVVPIASAHLVSYVKKQNIFESSETWVVILREVAQLMEQLNYSINFFLYVLLGDLFRSRLREALRSCRKRTSAVYSRKSSTSSSRVTSGSLGSVIRYNTQKKKNSADVLDKSDLSESRSSRCVNFADNYSDLSEGRKSPRVNFVDNHADTENEMVPFISEQTRL